MSPKERTRRALTHDTIDHLPTQINYTQSLGKIMSKALGIPIRELPLFLNNHLLRVDLDYKRRTTPDANIIFDWWGVGFGANEEGYFPAINPLADKKDLDDFPWPDPNDPDLLTHAEEQIHTDHGQHFVIPNFGFALFERAWSLRGFDNFLMDLALAPDFAGELLERITEIQLVLVNRFIKSGMDGGYFGDDYGTQKNMLFAPKTWRNMIKPRLARLFAPFRDQDLPVIMHSDGQISEILQDLIEIGLTTLNPIQPEVLDHTWLKSKFGNQLAYYGGISTQTVLPNGQPGDVKLAVRESISVLAPQNTGLLIAPSHRLMTDIPIQNIDALLEAFREFQI